MAENNIEWHVFEYSIGSPQPQLIDVGAMALSNGVRPGSYKFLAAIVKRGEFGLSPVVFLTQPALSEETPEYHQHFSSSQAVELIATNLRQQFDLDPARTFWLWHRHTYDGMGWGEPDEFWLLTFSWLNGRAVEADVIGCSRESARSLAGEVVLTAALKLHEAMQMNLNHERRRAEGKRAGV